MQEDVVDFFYLQELGPVLAVVDCGATLECAAKATTAALSRLPKARYPLTSSVVIKA